MHVVFYNFAVWRQKNRHSFLFFQVENIYPRCILRQCSPFGFHVYSSWILMQGNITVCCRVLLQLRVTDSEHKIYTTIGPWITFRKKNITHTAKLSELIRFSVTLFNLHAQHVTMQIRTKFNVRYLCGFKCSQRFALLSNWS